MSATEDRMVELAKRHLNLDRDLNLDAGLAESDVSSADAVSFIKRCAEEFNVAIPPEAVRGIKNMRGLAHYIDSHAG